MLDQTKSVVIFRKTILPYSETFIADQGRFLSKYSPLFCGFKKNSSGIGLLEGMSYSILSEMSSSSEISKMAFRLGMINTRWLKDISGYDPAVIHAHFLNDGIDALKLKQRLDVPLITTLHGHDITKREKTSIFRKSRAEFFASVDKVIAVSDYIYQHALEAGCPQEKLIKHSIGIDLGKFTQSKSEEEFPSILFVGRLVEKKGCIYLLQAMKMLQAEYKDARLTIVGDGPLKPKLMQEAENASINVEFVGKESPEDIRQRLSKAWVFAAPSITADNGDAEGLGMVFLEAQALMTPVVSYRSGGVVEAVEDGVSGLLSEEKDVEGLYESLKFFIANEDQRKEYGLCGRQRVEQYFDIKKQCLLLEDIYDSLY